MLFKLRTAIDIAAHRTAWLAGLVLLFGLVVFLSGHLFHSPITPFGDEASNSLGVFDAKHFTLLLGNFSRWHFHHPGPAYFYFLAGGEFLFHDWLRLTPVAFNAQILASILMSFLFAGGALAIFRRHFRSKAFPALAALTLALVACAVNHSLPDLALVTIWPPGWMLTNFLFFAAAAMAVGAGDFAMLPALAVGGALLAQSHASQGPFVAVISFGACAAGFRRQTVAGTWRELARQNRTRLIVSAALVAVVAAPIALEIWLHDPDNADAIHHYVWASRGHLNTFPQAVKFCAGFLLFTTDTERWALEPLRGQLLVALGRKWVIGFWFATLLLAATVWLRARRGGFTMSPFVRSALLVIALASAMFFVWSMKLTGEFFAFNGLFIYALHIAGLWLLCGILTDTMPDAWNRWSIPAALVALIALVAANAEVFRSDYPNHPVVRQALVGIGEMRPTEVKLQFDHDRWPVAMGIADGMARAGVPFCVGSQWTYMFGPERVCRDAFRRPILRVHIDTADRRASSSRLAEGPDRAVDLEPAARESLPLKIGVNDRSDEKEGFNEIEDGWRWTRRLAHVRFQIAGSREPLVCHRVRIVGIAHPGRPVSVLLNGVNLGTIMGQGRTTTEFAVGAGTLRYDATNDLALEVPSAGPIRGDRRELGFGFMSAEVAIAKGCP